MARNAAPGKARGSHDTALAGMIGAAIRDAREPDLTQGQLAARCGIDQPTMSRLERGTRPTPLTVYEMLRIEEATNRPPGWLLQHAGIVGTHERSAASAIASDATLPVIVRRMLLAALAAAVEMERDREREPEREPETVGA